MRNLAGRVVLVLAIRDRAGTFGVEQTREFV